MAIEVGDIIRVGLQWFAGGEDEQVNVHTFLVETLGGLTSDVDFMEALVTLLADEFYASVLPFMPSTTLGGSVTGINLTSNEVLPTVANTMDGGAVGNDRLARQLTALVCWNGVTPRRQGRTYLPSFDETSEGANGVWVSGALDALELFGAAALATLIDGGVGVSRVISNASGASCLFPTSATIPTSPRTQRRRTLGRGS
jgi:hypothetical protein